MITKYNGKRLYYWLGATDINSEGNWKWVNGEKWKYSNWNYGQPDNYNGKEHFLHMYNDSERLGLWNDMPLTSVDLGFICEYDEIPPVAVIEFNGHKYMQFDVSVSWSEAKEYCESLGGYLATLTSAEEEAAVVNMVSKQSKKSGYYLGATDAEKEGNWKWITGEEWNYSNWDTNQPSNDGNAENYLAIWNCKNNPSWNDKAEGYYPTYGFICEISVFDATLSYDANGGKNAPEVLECKTDTDITLSSKTPIRPGYIFKGWSERKDGEVKYQPSQTIKISTSTTLYAVWEEKNYTITYDANGGDYAPDAQTKSHGIDTYLNEDTVYQDGYTFIGWSIFDNASEMVESRIENNRPYDAYIQYYPGQLVNTDEDLELFAVWVDKSIAPNSITYYHEEKVIFIQVYNEYAEIISSNYDIDGWATWPYGNVYEYVAGDLYYESGENNLYSVTDGINSDDITGVYMPQIYFDANGGENAPYIQGHNLGEPFILTTEIPTRTDYIFVGWATTPDATIAEYLPGGEYVYDEELYLYAIWREDISGSCGDDAYWNIENGTLTITGTDTISNYEAGTAPWYEYKAGITDIVISDGITSVGDYAFYNLTALKTVSMPETLTDIGEYAFSNCVALENVDLSHISKIESYAFRYCLSLTDIVVYSDTSYGTNVYTNCSGINSVVINAGVTEIKENILNNCGTIASLEVPEAVTKISENAFTDCIFTSITYSGTKDEFAKLLTSENVLDFDTVTCESDNKTYLYSDFFAVNVKITEISLEKKSVGLYTGENVQIVATVTPSNATEKLVWSSDNKTVATVDNAGNVTAISEGITNITAKSESGDVQASCVVYINNVVDENAPAITVESIEETKNGDTFDVNISLKNNPGITSMRLALNYNTSVMELTNVEDLGMLGDSLHSEDYSGSEYVLYWDNGTSKTNFTVNENIATLTFAVKDTVKSGDYPITINYSSQDIINSDILPVSFDVVNGFVTVKAFTYGDVNSDESVDTMDSAYLSRHIARWSGITINSDAADVNKDKKTNVLDSAILKRHIANWPDYGTLPYYSPAKLFSTTNKAEELSPIISVSDAKGQSGKTVDVTISIKDNPGIVNMRLDVDYDKEALVLTKVTDSGLLPGEVHSNVLTDMPYCLYWDNGASKTDYTANGDLVKLTFEVKENAACGNYPITVSYKYDEPDIINASLEPVKVDINNGTIEIVDVIKPQIAVSNVEIGEKTNFTLQLLSPSTISGMIVVATYDKGTSKLCTLEKYDAMAQKDFSIDTENGEIVKIMWWDSFINLKPIADSLIVNEE